MSVQAARVLMTVLVGLATLRFPASSIGFCSHTRYWAVFPDLPCAGISVATGAMAMAILWLLDRGEHALVGRIVGLVILGALAALFESARMGQGLSMEWRIDTGLFVAGVIGTAWALRVGGRVWRLLLVAIVVALVGYGSLHLGAHRWTDVWIFLLAM